MHSFSSTVFSSNEIDRRIVKSYFIISIISSTRHDAFFLIKRKRSLPDSQKKERNRHRHGEEKNILYFYLNNFIVCRSCLHKPFFFFLFKCKKKTKNQYSIHVIKLRVNENIFRLQAQLLLMVHDSSVIDTNRDMFEYMVQLFSKSRQEFLVKTR